MGKLHHYRITKFDPKYRNDNGHFTRSDWTSICDDVGFDAYLKVESRYTKTVLDCIEMNRIGKIKVISEHNKYRTINLTTATRTVKTSDWGAVDLLVRMALREENWIKITGENGFYVHFGYDYYMYVGGKFRINEKRMNSLFVEDFKSPYLRR